MSKEASHIQLLAKTHHWASFSQNQIILWDSFVPEHDQKIAYIAADQPEYDKGKVGDVEEGEDGRQDDEGAQPVLGILRPAVVVEHGTVKVLVLQPSHHVLKVGSDKCHVHHEEDKCDDQLLGSILLHLEDCPEAICDAGDLKEGCSLLFINLKALLHEEGIDDAHDADGEGSEEDDQVAVMRILKLAGDETPKVEGDSQGDGDGT